MKSVICAPKRTPIGSFQGSLSTKTAPELGSSAIRATLLAAGLSPDKIQEVFMGCALTAGLGQAPARQAALGAGLNQNTPCVTVGKVCGSGLKAVMMADLAVRAGQISSAVAGGMESMSNAPYLMPQMRSGLRMGNGALTDSMIHDGLWDVYNNFHMGNAAEICAREHQISRQAQDEYALMSYERSQRAVREGMFSPEMASVEIRGKKENKIISQDEEPFRGDVSKFPTLKPVFEPTGTITAANASTLNDGAASVLVCSESFAAEHSLRPMARIISQSQAAQDPKWFTTAPAASMAALFAGTGVSPAQVDLWEINEAFSVVALANMKLLNLSSERVNVRGGAVALGHPIGASGARILVTLIHALEQTGGRYGVASLCIGGGEAVSVLIENLVR